MSAIQNMVGILSKIINLSLNKNDLLNMGKLQINNYKCTQNNEKYFVRYNTV